MGINKETGVTDVADITDVTGVADVTDITGGTVRHMAYLKRPCPQHWPNSCPAVITELSLVL